MHLVQCDKTMLHYAIIILYIELPTTDIFFFLEDSGANHILVSTLGLKLRGKEGHDNNYMQDASSLYRAIICAVRKSNSDQMMMIFIMGVIIMMPTSL